MREAGQTLDRVGASLQGNFAWKEELCRHRRIMEVIDKKPSVGHDVFIAPSASVIGEVTVGEGSSIWYGTILRGDVNKINIGKNSSIGHRTVVHVDSSSEEGYTNVGDNVIVGNSVTLHACKLEDNCLIEDGSVILDSAVVESNSIVGPGSVVTKNKRVPSGQYWAGNPAKFVRNLEQKEMSQIGERAKKDYDRSKMHEEIARKSCLAREEDKVFNKHYQHYPSWARWNP
eukprot:CAMPEP_0174258432 /NCGR_PEP_ID=MMETSP0439-20130205/7421_1 /TAXON_ID=0 /ORGANISM="Stereomyxa ramosa, Strain Chinc5" /LENGTH=229 /DNA_ID=CAMNT_0015341933 /DNA_START=49 /DNA_END=738 /DNA_ORIENTATION=-